MKITTEHCIYAIMKHYYETENDNPLLLKFKLWKRLSKSGTGNRIVRVFQNKETGTIVNVISSETEIFRVVEAQPNITGTSIKSYLREKMKEFDFYELPYEILGEYNVAKWPQVTLPPFEEGDEPELEPLDMENFEWLSITDDELVVACGGDWQEPLTLTIKLINGKLTVVKTETNEWQDGMDEETFIKSLQ